MMLHYLSSCHTNNFFHEFVRPIGEEILTIFSVFSHFIQGVLYTWLMLWWRRKKVYEVCMDIGYLCLNTFLIRSYIIIVYNILITTATFYLFQTHLIWCFNACLYIHYYLYVNKMNVYIFLFNEFLYSKFQ